MTICSKAPAIGTRTLASEVPMQATRNGLFAHRQYTITASGQAAPSVRTASFTGVKPAAMREFCRQGKIHAFKARTVWRIPRPALLRFMLGGDGDE